MFAGCLGMRRNQNAVEAWVVFALAKTHLGPGSEGATAFVGCNVLLKFPNTEFIHINNYACNVMLQNKSPILIG